MIHQSYTFLDVKMSTFFQQWYFEQIVVHSQRGIHPKQITYQRTVDGFTFSFPFDQTDQSLHQLVPHLWFFFQTQTQQMHGQGPNGFQTASTLQDVGTVQIQKYGTYGQCLSAVIFPDGFGLCQERGCGRRTAVFQRLQQIIHQPFRVFFKFHLQPCVQTCTHFMNAQIFRGAVQFFSTGLNRLFAMYGTHCFLQRVPRFIFKIRWQFGFLFETFQN